MFKGLSTGLLNIAIRRNIVEADMLEEYTYGLNMFFTITLNVLSALAIGIVMHMLLEIIIFIVTYKTLRKYVGGSHSKNALRCYISSCIVYILVLIAVKYCKVSNTILTIGILGCTAIVFIIAPVEAEKKPLDEIEKRVFGRRSKIIICIVDIIYLVFAYLIRNTHFQRIHIVIVVSIIAVTIFALEGKIRQLIT